MRVSDTAAVEKILKAVADSESVALIMLMRTRSKSAQGLSAEAGIPQSTVYRKLDELREAGLVMTEHSAVNGGKRIDFLVVTFSEIRMSVGGDKVVVDIIPSSENANAKWLDLFRGG